MPMLLSCVLALTLAAAFVPPSDTEVLEQVPRRDDPRAREVRLLDAELRAAPSDAAVAAKVTKRFLDLAREEGDPRWIGRAQNALRPWWEAASPPEPILVLRATIKQSLHDFPAALGDLDRAVQQAPRDGQAWLTRAAVEQVRGDTESARSSCSHLAGLTRPLVPATCSAGVLAGEGKLPAAQAYLGYALAQDDGREPAVTRWALTLLAEMAARAGNAKDADRLYRKAMQLGEPDAYLLASFSDFLLDQGRAAEVRTLLRGSIRADALLLRLALAEKELHDPALAQHLALLQDRFDAARARGETVHRREEAIFELHLKADARKALALAKANWEVQREPLDARVLKDAEEASR